MHIKFSEIYRGKLKSLYVPDSVQYCIDYKLDEWISPKIGKIFTFDTYMNALAYQSRYTNFHKDFSTIYLALISDYEKPMLISAYQGSMYIERAWKDQLETRYYIPAPKGTLLSSQIKLIKKLN